jgi:hypothetical protein
MHEQTYILMLSIRQMRMYKMMTIRIFITEQGKIVNKLNHGTP